MRVGKWELSMNGICRLIFGSTLIFVYVNILNAADTLTPTQSLIDGKTLISSGQVFELGFFSPGNSESRYLGIWYKNIPLTVVWVANRNRPLADKSGALNITNDNNLVLVNRNGSIFWSTNSTIGASPSSIAQILNSGNLILRDANSKNDSGNYLWQSFDHPADTLLPGMKIGWELKTGMNRILTSWTSSDDPSTSNCSCSIDRKVLPQIVIRMGATELFRTGEWYGDRFSGRHVVASDSVFNAVFVYNFEEVYFTIEEDQCDTYNFCGANAICDINLEHNCKCLSGFEPNSSKDWAVFNTAGGCVRISPLDCGKGEGFIRYSGVKLPDVVDLKENISIGYKDCEAFCLKNCSCLAYAHSNSSGNEQGCLFWYGDLVDIRYVLSDYGQDLYVRLSASALKSMSDSRRRRRQLALIIILSVSSVLLLMGLITLYVVQKKRKRKKMYTTGNQLFKNQRCRNADSDEEDDGELPAFDLATIAAATTDFSFGNKIGEGGFGPVYKGILSTGQEIAVKRLSQTSGQGINELKNEIILMSKLQHRNLVRLLGCCTEGEERMLIYEYMANGSLDTYIFGKERRKHLLWNARFEIISGIARGLLYLHRDSRLRIIHRDLKASNILLDGEMEPKISDFGLARIFGGDKAGTKTRKVMGTYGYLSPEYAVDGHFSIKSDVFSFGVLVLEIINGARNRGFYHRGHGFNLLGHAWNLWNEGKTLELVDASMGDQFSRAQVLRCIHVGLLCVQQRPEVRPEMPMVLMMLNSENAVLPEPKQPGFYTERNLNETDHNSQWIKSGTSNELSVTIIEGR
ncbi:hypothetical protein Nepgr_026816 [Nepenthes gracilis]|uniref:Receptor-like serine/threonine-protein kinase n=1 Tax=Nepenthes gracilis TaxID=150966 RepID=A0AAD3Y0W5_NEPGR|nr:hypothetical protein Nepgr_026816 [Nepenthes gracilis]